MLENSKPSNVFSTNKILNALKDKSVNLIAVDRLSSTNTVLKSLTDVLPDKTILIADCQTAGRGRINKSFFSPNGCGIYLSILLRKNFSCEDALMLTPLTAVSVLDVVKKFSNNVKIKWVNDIYIGDKKVCGILTESSFNNSQHTDYVIIGIGLNVKKPKDNFPNEISNIATALFDYQADVDINSLAAKIINNLLSRIDAFDRDEIKDIYTKYSYLDGKKVNVLTANITYEARVLGVDKNLNLMVENNNGEMITLSSGEVSTIPLI